MKLQQKLGPMADSNQYISFLSPNWEPKPFHRKLSLPLPGGGGEKKITLWSDSFFNVQLFIATLTKL